MKKLNNRGFLLVETVIVSVFVLTIFILVYQNSVPMIEEYEHRLQYDDVDSVYGIGLVRNLILDDSYYYSFTSEVDNQGYKVITCNDLSNVEACTVIFEKLGIKSDNYVILSKWDVAPITKITNLPSGFTDYVLYLDKQDQEQVSNYRLLISRTSTYEVETKDKETEEIKTVKKTKYYYANIAM